MARQFLNAKFFNFFLGLLNYCHFYYIYGYVYSSRLQATQTAPDDDDEDDASKLTFLNT
jgi:hypothetical protein